MIRLFLSSAFWLAAAAAFAQSSDDPAQRQPSTCLAIAENIHSPELPVHYASLTQPAQATKYDVIISYQGHSTYLIESPGGTKVATDFAGWLTDPVTPDAVTMNQAHSSHYTLNPDPKIKHVLWGWAEKDVAKHHLMVGDVLIRNVTTDLHRFGFVPDGNSIFIFEAGGLCIGHLGHLHHKLAEDHYTKIGRLDVVMVAVDGGITMTHLSAKEIIERLRSSVVLPMHVRAYGALPRFLSYLGPDFPVKRLKQNRLVLNLRNLPKQPTVMLLPGLGFAGYDE